MLRIAKAIIVIGGAFLVIVAVLGVVTVFYTSAVEQSALRQAEHDEDQMTADLLGITKKEAADMRAASMSGDPFAMLRAMEAAGLKSAQVGYSK